MSNKILHITFGPDHHTEICGTVFDASVVGVLQNGTRQQVVSLFGDQFFKIYTGNEFEPQALRFDGYAPVTQEMLATIKDEEA